MQGESFEVRFHVRDRLFRTNPFNFHGKGSLTFEPDFVTVRGLRLGSNVPEEHRLRMVDIVNVCSDGTEFEFDVLGVKEDLTLTFKVPDPVHADRIMELLPARQMDQFTFVQAEREVFHDRLDHWTPGTPIVKTLLVANVLMFVLMSIYSSHILMQPGSVLKLWGSNAGSLTLKGQGWRLVTSMFVHGGLLHIVLNMLALWVIGRLAERMFGSARYIALYMIAGVFGSLTSVMWNPHVNSVGASGALFGIIGGLLAFIGRADSGVPPTIIKKLRGSLSGVLMFALTFGFVYPHTDNAAHIGGLVSGYLAGLLLARSLHVPDQQSQ